MNQSIFSEHGEQEIKPRVLLNLIRHALTNLGAQAAIFQKDCTLIWATDPYKNTFGYESVRSRRTCLDHMHENEECPEFLISKTVKTGTIQHSVFKIEDEQGYLTYFNTFSFPMYDSESNFTNVIEVCWHISNTEALDTLSGGHNALLRSLADTALDAILVTDANDAITFWNKGADNLLGYQFNDVIHENFRLIFPESEKTERDLNLMQQLLLVRGYLKNFETELQNKDGNTVKVEITRAFMNPERMERMGSYWIIRDITMRKSLEYRFQRTIEKLAKLHEIADLMHRPIIEKEIYQAILVSLTAGEGLRFNRAFLLMLNFKNRFLEGKLAIGPSDPEEAGILWQQIPRQFTSLEEILESFKMRDHNIHEKVIDIVQALTTPLDDESSIMIQAIKNRKSYLVQNGTCDVEFDTEICSIINCDTFAVIPIITLEELVGVLIVDNVYNREQITEDDIDALEILSIQAGFALDNARLHKNLSLRLEELENAYSTLQDSQEKLVKSGRFATIGEVVAKVSHEIRNPLVNIGGFTNQLLRTADPNSEEHHFLTIIADESKRLERILGDILNYSTEFQPKKELVNLQDLLKKNLLILMDEMESHAIALNLELDESDTLVYIDPTQLTQVFLNMLRNCIQAMPKGGKLSISFQRDNNFIITKIKDSGVGIKKKDMEYLFQPFYTTKSKGLGLGLAISLQIMNSHGGKIEVESRYRRGTTFSIYLPVT